MNILPDKLSELLRMAVNDCKEIETKSNYKFNMRYWFVRDNDICEVCMAGAVLACKKQLPNNDLRTSANLNDYLHSEIAQKINNINSLRVGDFSGIKTPSGDYLYNASNFMPEPFFSIRKLIHDNWLDNSDKGRTPFGIGLHRADWDTYLKAADMLEAAGY